MKKKQNLLLVLSSFLLCGCNPLQENFNFQSEDNFDVDPVTSIIEDNTSSSGEDTSLDVFDDEPDDETQEEVSNNNVISSAGTYHLQGNYSDFKITASKGSEITIYLDGVNITSTKGIAFSSEKNITLHLILMEGSVNTISNDYVVAGELSDENAFHIKGNVTISGKGTLNVTSTVKNALKVSKDLVVCEGVTINANAVNHAIAAQSFASKGATLNLNTSGKDGINVECDGEISTYTTEQGYVYLENSNVIIDAKGDGVQAATYIQVSGGTLDITTHGEFIAYSSSLISSGDYTRDDFKYEKSGSTYKRKASDEIRNLSTMYALKESVKGLKVSGVEYEDANGNEKEVTTGDYVINICHLANIKINSTDDCVHANYGDVEINSANIELTSLDDGVHADYDLNINNAAITINNSYEGLEGANVTIDGENTNIVTVSQDDGINAASDYGTSHNIKINNGYFRVYASGDGLDANTGLYLNGGIVIVEGPGSNNGSLDADKVYFNGGIVFACSTNGMVEQMQATQNTFVYGGSSIASGSQMSIMDSSNNSLFTYTLKQSCSQIIFSHPDMVIGQTYKILKGTTTVTSIKLTSSITRSGSTGGGGGNPPGGGGGHR